MARIRSIKPEFPQSESMGKVSRDARLLFVELWCLCDDHGRTRAPSRMLASLLFPYDDDAPSLIDGWLDELEREECITRYVVAGSMYIEVVNWVKHQKIDKPSKPLFPAPDQAKPYLNANPGDPPKGVVNSDPREPSRGLASPRELSVLERKGREGKGEEESESCARAQVSPATAARLAMIRGGVEKTRTTEVDPELLELVSKLGSDGEPLAKPELFEAVARENPGKGMRYVIRTVAGRLGDAARQGHQLSPAANAFARTEKQNYEPGALSRNEMPSWMQQEATDGV